MEIIIKGKPIAKARPKFYRRGKHVGTYNPQESEEGRWLWEAKQQITECFDGPIKVYIEFYFSRPKSHYGTGQNKDVLKMSSPKYHLQKPDIDNCVKFVLDCLNGHAFKDDKQIFAIEAYKSWDDWEEESTFVQVTSYEKSQNF